MALDFFYDSQIRRYLLQFTRIFALFQYQSGVDLNGDPILKRVPARYASRDRMVGHILRNNSENVVLSTPFITVWVSNMAIARDRTQSPNFISTVQVSERKLDPITNQYTGEIGDMYTVQRFMPVPYDLTMQVDIWTTNMEQKLQLLEQIGVLFNPAMDIQSSVNPIDWTALTYTEVTDINWDSRSIPIGVDSDISISGFTHKLPIWINPPAKLKKQTVIETLITTICDAEAFEEGSGFDPNSSDNAEQGGFGIGGTPVECDEDDLITRKVTTLACHRIIVDGNEITLIGEHGTSTDENGDLWSWKKVLDEFGELRPGISIVKLITSSNLEEENKIVKGIVELHPTEVNKLLFSPDLLTLPVNTLDPIDAIIDPHSSYPTSGLPAAAPGQRYLLTDEIGDTTEAWGTLTAGINDIIEFDGVIWDVAFDASETTSTEILVNNFTGKQLEWNGEEWIFAVDREYFEGFWRLLL